MKNVLVRKRRHQGPMHAVLTRYGIGKADQYDRGRWISEADLPLIEVKMETDKTAIRGVWNGHPYLFVQGTNKHNSVGMEDFRELFGR